MKFAFVSTGSHGLFGYLSETVGDALSRAYKSLPRGSITYFVVSKSVNGSDSVTIHECGQALQGFVLDAIREAQRILINARYPEMKDIKQLAEVKMGYLLGSEDEKIFVEAFSQPILARLAKYREALSDKASPSGHQLLMACLTLASTLGTERFDLSVAHGIQIFSLEQKEEKLRQFLRKISAGDDLFTES